MSKPKIAAGAAVPARRSWMPVFLAALAETSNVKRAARKAGVSTAVVYEARRRQREFARQWQAALSEGYDNLEMDLLGRLREGELKPPAGSKRSARNFDNNVALRLLIVHREAREREKGLQATVSAADVRASLDRKIASLRARVLAQKEADEARAAASGQAVTACANDNCPEQGDAA